MHFDNVHGISASGVNIVEFDLTDYAAQLFSIPRCFIQLQIY